MRSVEGAVRTTVVFVALATLPGRQAAAQETEDRKPDAPLVVRADAGAAPAEEEAPPMPAEVGESTPERTETYDLQPSQERLIRSVLDPTQLADVMSMGVVLARTGSIEDVRQRWEELVRQTRPHAANLPLIVRAVLRESYREANREAHLHADRVRFYDELIGSLRREIERTEEEASFGREGLEEWEEYRRELGETLASVEEVAQGARLDLQGARDRQQETVLGLPSLAGMLREAGIAALR